MKNNSNNGVKILLPEKKMELKILCLIESMKIDSNVKQQDW